MEKETTKRNIDTTLPFILVSDKTFAQRLKDNGFVCVNETDTMCTFINNGKLVFSDNESVVFSRMLCI